jgi:hypothetical protein
MGDEAKAVDAAKLGDAAAVAAALDSGAQIDFKCVVRVCVRMSTSACTRRGGSLQRRRHAGLLPCLGSALTCVSATGGLRAHSTGKQRCRGPPTTVTSR